MSRLIIKTIREFETLASTSDTARELVAAGEVELPLLVVAHNQTAGRGRGENLWWSDEGSLTCSIAFDPATLGLRREHEPRIALAAAVAIVRTCEAIAPLGIRWPNDVECCGKKVGGLLPESIATAVGPRFILGIGLNVTTDLLGAPPEVRSMATSLAESGVGTVDKSTLMAALIEELGEVFDELASDDPALPRTWSSLDTLLGQDVNLKLGDETLKGIGAGIAADGALVVRTENGERVFHGGQVLRAIA